MRGAAMAGADGSAAMRFGPKWMGGKSRGRRDRGYRAKPRCGRRGMTSQTKNARKQRASMVIMVTVMSFLIAND